MIATPSAPDNDMFDRMLNPIRDALTPEVAQAIVDLRADATVQARIEDLADRHHEGQLTADELAEYANLVGAVNMIAVLQAKARSVLKARRAS
jgi:hypothetical protein